MSESSDRGGRRPRARPAPSFTFGGVLVLVLLLTGGAAEGGSKRRKPDPWQVRALTPAERCARDLAAGRELSAHGAWEEAEGVLSETARACPEDVSARAELGRARLALAAAWEASGRPLEGLMLRTEALPLLLPAERARAESALTEAFLGQRLLAEALPRILEGAMRDTTDPRAAALAAYSHLRRGDFPAAADLYARAVRHAPPGNPLVPERRLWADALVRCGRTGDALVVLSCLIGASAEAAAQVANLDGLASRTAAPLSDLARVDLALARAPDDPCLLLARGLLLDRAAALAAGDGKRAGAGGSEPGAEKGVGPGGAGKGAQTAAEPDEGRRLREEAAAAYRAAAGAPVADARAAGSPCGPAAREALTARGKGQ